MNEIQIFNYNSSEVRTIQKDGEPWFVLKDVCEVFGETNYRRVSGRLEDDEKGVSQIATPGGLQNMTVINEAGLYSALFMMQPEKARGVSDEYIAERQAQLKAFKRWVTHEVLPAIRKTGMYLSPKIDSAMLYRVAEELEQKEKEVIALTAENERQRQVIQDYEPKMQYLDTILASRGTMATTQIAADYDLTARQLNKILHDAGIQHNVNGQWILYRKHMGMGYTKSETIPITRSDGRPDTKIFTRWTQKGRLLIHDILTSNGIQANMDKDLSA